jgi:dihydroceramide fatty acyl 2-hydroxylase
MVAKTTMSTLSSTPSFDTDAADAPGEQRTGRPRVLRGSARMFESPLLERFSRAHPAMPAVVYGPVALIALVQGVRSGKSLAVVLLEAVLGYVTWTLFEYWLHRLLFHLPVRGPKTQRAYFLIHGMHHDYPWDETRLVMPLGASLALCVIVFSAFRALLGGSGMWGPFGGFVLGYIFYDTVHWYVHARSPTSGLGGWLRREHFLHHFRSPAGRFGVSCPWLDYVFATRGPRR